MRRGVGRTQGVRQCQGRAAIKSEYGSIRGEGESGRERGREREESGEGEWRGRGEGRGEEGRYTF